MKLEKAKAQMRKGVLEYCILSIISEKEVYASDILTLLQESQLIVVEGTLYPLLTRLKNERLLNYRWEESKTGPPRKYYSITSSGQELLSMLNQSWNELVNSIQKVTKNIN